MKYLLCLTLLTASAVLVVCTTDFSRPVNSFDYQRALQQGFDGNYFKNRVPTWYRRQHFQDIYNRGFRNFRIRIEMEIFGRYMTDRWWENPNNTYKRMLDKVKEMVTDGIDIGLLPVVAWRHSVAEAYGTEEHFQQFLNFWRDMADQFRNTSYQLSFNLVTELGHETCYARSRKHECNYNRTACCSESLKFNQAKYHRWMSEAIRVIRESGGNNMGRIVIIPSPEKTETGLKYLNNDMPYLVNKSDIMVEWHTRAAGPSRYRNDWSGNGTERQKENTLRPFRVAEQFTRDTQIPTYCAEWGAIDNQHATVPESDIIAFARFFVNVLKAEEIPWSLNAIEKFYNTKAGPRGDWREVYMHRGRHTNQVQQLNVSRILNVIIDEMQTVS